MQEPVLHEVAHRAGEGRPVAGDRHRFDVAEHDALGEHRAGELVKRHRLTCDGAVGPGPLEDEQRVDETGQALGVMAQVGEDLGIGAVAGGVVDVAQQRGDGRAQLMGGIGEKSPLARLRLLEGGEHPIEHAGQLADLVGDPRVGQAPGRIGGALDLARRVGEQAKRPQTAPGEHRGGDHRQHHDRGPQEGDRRPEAAGGMGDVGGVGGDEHGSARGRAAGIGNRCGVHAHRSPADLDGLRPGATVQTSGPLERVLGEQLGAKGQRAGDDPPASIEHLDDDLASRGRTLQGARIVEDGRR